MATQPEKPSLMIFALGFSMLFSAHFVMLAPTASGYFVRIEPARRGSPRVFLRDARGHESSISAGTRYLEGVRPGDPLHKSPGNDDIRPWPAGEPFPEPVWFRFGYGDFLIEILALMGAGAFAVHEALRRRKLAENPE